MNERFFTWAVFLPLCFCACGKKKPPRAPEPVVVAPDAGVEEEDPPIAPMSLYDRLGGTEAMKEIVEKFVENVTQDPAVSKVFKNTKGPKLDLFKKNLADQLCELTGGPCTYGGKDMKTAHQGLKITGAQFDALLNDLKLALGELKIAVADQDELADKLAALKEDIVGPKKK